MVDIIFEKRYIILGKQEDVRGFKSVEARGMNISSKMTFYHAGLPRRGNGSFVKIWQLLQTISQGEYQREAKLSGLEFKRETFMCKWIKYG